MAITSKNKKQSRERKSKDGANKFNKASKQSFKAKKNKDLSKSSEAMALQLEDDVPDFPRGGGSSLSLKEREEIRAEVDAEFEAEEKVLLMMKKKKGKKLRNKSQSDDDFGSLFCDGLTGKLPRFANKITFKNISPGVKLWGVVAEVNEKDLVISLPGGLRGLVRSVDALDPVFGDEIQDIESNLPSLFNIGQLVSCTVLKIDDDKKDSGKRKIWLSLCLSMLYKGFSLDAVQEGMVLTAYVKSIEDHGYILHFGLPTFMGFLPKNNQDDSRFTELKIGQLLQGIVRTINKNHKVVYLSSEPETVSKCVIRDLKGISIDLLVPGMMVNARVQSILENGIMLSFLTYFSGTVDIFHLQNAFPSSNWRDDYNSNKKINARILFVDPSTRAVGLTLNQHLVHNRAPPVHVKVGDIYDGAKVVRVDKSMGLLLEIPSAPVSTPAYVCASDVAETEVRNLEKKFKAGSKVRVRIHGYKHLEGLATGILKESAFVGPVFTHSDVQPGMVVRAKVIAVESFGAIVQFPGGLKALCPLRHMSELEIVKPTKKFKVGAELLFRVLGCKSKRITVTHKKTLVKSKLAVLSSYAEASEGLITHGWITKIEKHGCFVHFYNGVQGFAHRSELGLEPGTDASSVYQVGQVVKCRVLSSLPGSHRINLSFIMNPTRVSVEDVVKLGSVIAGVVENVTTNAIIVHINAKGCMRGTVSTEHLADHYEQATTLKSVLKPGYKFEQLLVIDIENNSLVLSAKYSLLNSADQLPSDLSQIHPQSIVHGYICNIIETGCFVRFLGRLTGFSPKSKAMDNKKAQLSEAFYIGQSVRSSIIDVSTESNRITVSLKQSCCSSIDASFLQGYFRLEEKVAELQSSDSKGPGLKWVEEFSIGSVVEAKIQETKEVGVVVSFDKYNDILGFITHYQLGGTTVEKGSIVRAAVLDVAKTERLMDLSVKPEFLNKCSDEISNGKTHRKKRKRETSKKLELHQTVNAIVEIVKENYVVLSIPDHDYAIGYASVSDYNTQKLPQKQFLNGQSVIATVMALPGPSTAGRLLLLLKSVSEAVGTSSAKKTKRKSSYNVGSLVEAEITEKKLLEMRLKFGIGFRGRIHITEVNDDCSSEDPFANFRIGQTVTARIVAKADKTQLWELSVKPEVLTDVCEPGDKLISEEFNFPYGHHVTGYVYKVDSEWAWLTVSRRFNAQLYFLDSACEPNELQEFQKHFFVGKAVSGYVASCNKEKKLLRLVQRPLGATSSGHVNGEPLHRDGAQGDAQHDKVAAHIHEGDIVGGRIFKILPGVGGMLVQIGPHLHGRVHFTELQDSWVPDPLCGYHEGQFVKCKVLEISHSVKGTIHIDLSLRSSLSGTLSQSSSEHLKNENQRVENIEDLQSNTVVQGYVKNVSSKGCFILLSRKIDAKILLSNLSNEFIDNPERDFPIGKLVTGRVLSVEPVLKRVEVTLNLSGKSKAKSEPLDFGCIHVGDVISGRIKRVESYGLFIVIDHTNLVGLCHASELSDDHVNSIEVKYRAGERVTARILKVDEDRRRISLGMKNLDNGNDTSSLSKEEPSEAISENDSIDDSGLKPRGSSFAIEGMEIESKEECAFLAHAESRASIPPLNVTLDDIEDRDVDDIIGQNQGHIGEAETGEEKEKRRAKKKSKKEREQEIRAAEERLLESDIPRTADEFEKLVHVSPNSSFVWIKYMAFMLELADIEKARAIAERALRTINFREEDEKLNVWVAYFNLENQYGNPPEEAVKRVFQRALQYCDPKKVHLALLGVYERTEQLKLADELLDRMVKKFKQSAKIWLKRVQRALKQGQDAIQHIVQRALLSLPRHKHIKFISQTAILEFKCGVPDRGRSLFEGILREYPKRTDLWSVYLDQEIKLGDVDLTRTLFERATSLSLPAKKMQFLFKKYLEFEKSIGDKEQIEAVKKKAMEYVENTMTG